MTGLGHKKNSFQSCTLLVCACQDTINEPFFISQYLVSVCRFSGRSVSQVNLSLRGGRKKERGGGREKSAKEGKGTQISLNTLSIWRWFLLRKLRRGAKCWDYESVAKSWDGECQIHSLTGKCRRRHKENNLNYIPPNACWKLFLYKILPALWTSGNLSIVKMSICW